MIHAPEPVGTLDDIRIVRRAVADRVACPLWWRFTVALLAGGMCAAQAGSVVVALVGTLACFAVLAAMLVAAKRRLDIRVNVLRSVATRRVAVGLFLAVEAVYGVGLWAKHAQNIGWAPIAGGVVIAAIALVAGSLYQRALRTEFGAASIAR